MDDKLGLRIENMNRANADEFRFSEPDGVVITDVQVNGPAARRGLVAGFKILEMNRQRVDDMRDVRRIMNDVDPGDIVTLHVAGPDDSRRIVMVRAAAR